MTLHNDQGINPRRRYNNYKYLCTQHRSTSIQMLTAIKEEINSNTIMVGDFNTPISSMDRSSKIQINKQTQALNDTLNKMDIIDIHRTFHPKTTEYTFFSSAHGTFSRIDHTLGHKSSLGKFQKTEIIKYLFRPQCYETRYQLQEKNL